MHAIPETYRQSNFEDELSELLELAKDEAEASCNAVLCRTPRDFERMHVLRDRLDEHRACFVARWERLAMESARRL